MTPAQEKAVKNAIRDIESIHQTIGERGLLNQTAKIQQLCRNALDQLNGALEHAKLLADASRMLDDAAQRLYVLEAENERLRNEHTQMTEKLGLIAERLVNAASSAQFIDAVKQATFLLNAKNVAAVVAERDTVIKQRDLLMQQYVEISQLVGRRGDEEHSLADDVRRALAQPSSTRPSC